MRLKNQLYLWGAAYAFKIQKYIPPKVWWELYFRKKMGYWCNLWFPKTFNEKLCWLKFNYHNPLYTIMADKVAVKQYVANIIGEDHIIPTLNTYKNVNEVNWEELPEQFVIKCNHDNGSTLICKDKGIFDIKKAEAHLASHLAVNFYTYHYEWAYKNITPMILVEKLLQDDRYAEIMDYKFYCFDGIPRFLYVSTCSENHTNCRMSFMTTDWQLAPFQKRTCPMLENVPTKPSCFEEMMQIASQLSSGMPFLRVDLYEVGKHVFFSELTAYPTAGVISFSKEWDKKIGDMLHLPAKMK